MPAPRCGVGYAAFVSGHGSTTCVRDDLPLFCITPSKYLSRGLSSISHLPQVASLLRAGSPAKSRVVDSGIRLDAMQTIWGRDAIRCDATQGYMPRTCMWRWRASSACRRWSFATRVRPGGCRPPPWVGASPLSCCCWLQLSLHPACSAGRAPACSSAGGLRDAPRCQACRGGLYLCGREMKKDFHTQHTPRPLRGPMPPR